MRKKGRMSKKLIVLRGLPGSGKSTYQRAHFPAAVVASADLYFMVGEEYRFNPALLPEAHGACCRTVVGALQAGTSLIIVDNTAISAVEIAPYILLAQAYGYDAEIITLRCDPAVAAARNTHGVPVGVILERMAPAMAAAEASFPPWWNHQSVAV